MKENVFRKAMLIGSVLSSSAPLLADAGDVTTSGGLAKLAAGLAIGLGAAGAAMGQGKAASAAFEGLARNPSSRDVVFTPFMLALAFMEMQALLAFVIALAIHKNL